MMATEKPSTLGPKQLPQKGKTVPRLRFPEFEDAGEWEMSKAGNLFANRVNKGEERLPLYSVTMHDGMVRRDSLDRNYYDIEDAAGNKKACKNDIAYNMMRMWQGALGVAPKDCLVSPAYIVLAPQRNVVSRFFEYQFKLPATLQLLTAYSRGLTKDRLRLYYDDFARIPLQFPSKSEQQKIADCLGSLDEVIAAAGRQLEALRQHKKGLLQQIFPQEGETVPRLRFPEFEDAGEWDAKPLDNLCDRRTETVGDSQLTPVSISVGKGFVPQAEKFGRDISGSQYGRYICLQRGDFAYNRGNSKRFPQGCVYQLTEFDEAAASNAFHCFRLHDNLESAFFLGFFETNGHGRQLIRHITSGARSNGLLNINANTFFGITVPLPPTPAEQQKIADCLGSLDEVIAAAGRKLDALREHKKGLLQQLFPSLDGL